MDQTSGIEWIRTSENDDRVALAAMLGAENRGDYVVLASFISRLGARLSDTPDHKTRAAYRALVDRAVTAFEYEAQHGRRSLMKWGHPVNIEWVRIGLIKLTEDEHRAFLARNGGVVSVEVQEGLPRSPNALPRHLRQTRQY